MNKEQTNTTNKNPRLSACTEAYKEHIMYTFNAFAKLLYAMQLSTHGVTGAGGRKEKYLLSILQKKSFTRSVRQINIS